MKENEKEALTAGILARELSLCPLCAADPSRKVTNGYCGDLLSWVMGRAPADSAWVTVMSNSNVIAVALLCDCACVIIAEGASLDADALTRAKDKGINIYTSSRTEYELCAGIAKLLG